MPRSGYVADLRRMVGHELLLLPSVTACIFDQAGRMLLLWHADGGWWATPGGALEPGESPAEAVVRECREETGLLVRPVEILGVFGGGAYEMVYDNGDRVQYVMTAFRCEVVGGELEPDGSEVTAARYVGVDEWQQLTLPRWAHDAFPVLYDCHRPVHQRPPAPDRGDGPLIVDEQRLQIADGELDGVGSWVYVWLTGEGVIHVGATGLPPAVRSWLHLHDEAPEVGRVRAQHPEALIGQAEVHAFRLAEGLDRQQVKQALLARLEGPSDPPAERPPAVEAAAAEIVDRLRALTVGQART
jgi:8-oxo-dGTP pyrophosphatase MutT (NUDIX family)